MKIVLLFSVLFLTACFTSYEKDSKRFLNEAKEYCSCHKGISRFIYNDYSFDLICNDGTHSNGNGPIYKQHFYADCMK